MADGEIAWIAWLTVIFGVAIRWRGYRGGSQFVILPRWLYERGVTA